MKKLLIVFIAVALFACESAEEKSADASTTISDNKSADAAPATPRAVTTIEWIDPPVKEMGKITEGQQVEVSWRYKNTGSQPLVISKIKSSCGCTTTEPPKEPIAPGAEGIIKATFNSNGRIGTNHRQVEVEANTQPSFTALSFNVEVLKKG